MRNEEPIGRNGQAAVLMGNSGKETARDSSFFILNSSLNAGQM